MTTQVAHFLAKPLSRRRWLAAAAGLALGLATFSTAKAEDTIIMVLTTNAPYPSEVAPDANIPRALEDLVIRALEKSPHERAASATAMAAELAAT